MLDIDVIKIAYNKYFLSFRAFATTATRRFVLDDRRAYLTNMRARQISHAFSYTRVWILFFRPLFYLSAPAYVSSLVLRMRISIYTSTNRVRSLIINNICTDVRSRARSRKRRASRQISQIRVYSVSRVSRPQAHARACEHMNFARKFN